MQTRSGSSEGKMGPEWVLDLVIPSSSSGNRNTSRAWHMACYHRLLQVQGMTQLPPTTTLGFPPQPASLGMQGVPMGMQGMRPMMSTMPGGPSGMMVAGGAAPMMMPNANPIMGANMQEQPQQQQQPQAAAQPQNSAVQLDPFGAL